MTIDEKMDELARQGAVDAYVAHGAKDMPDAEGVYCFLTSNSDEPYPGIMPVEFEVAYDRYASLVRDLIANQLHNAAKAPTPRLSLEQELLAELALMDFNGQCALLKRIRDTRIERAKSLEAKFSKAMTLLHEVMDGWDEALVSKYTLGESFDEFLYKLGHGVEFRTSADAPCHLDIPAEVK